jgi:hypothetical protein
LKKALKQILKNESGDAVVEATFLFPIIIMTFIAFILLAMYLPTYASMHRCVQKAAVIASAQRSDLGYVYDTVNNSAGIDFNILKSQNVYAYMMRGFDKELETGNAVAEKYSVETFFSGNNFSVNSTRDSNDGRYITITAEQTMKMPFDFPLLHISNEFQVKVSARAMVRDADEFIRNTDIVSDLVIKKSQAVNETLGDISNFLDVFNRVKAFFKF